MFSLKRIPTDELVIDFGVKDGNLHIHIYKGETLKDLNNLYKIVDPILSEKFGKEINDVDILIEQKYKEIEEEAKKSAFSVTTPKGKFEYHQPVSLKSIRELYSNTKINRSFTRFKDELYNSWDYMIPNFTNTYNLDEIMLDLTAKILERLSA